LRIELARQPSTPTSPLGELPPLLPLSADAPQATPPKPPAAAVERTAESDGDSHGDASNLRGNRPGDLTTPEGAPANDTYTLPGIGCDSSDFAQGWGSYRFPPPPRIDFPLFEGTSLAPSV
jgi:hypothetical protein